MNSLPYINTSISWLGMPQAEPMKKWKKDESPFYQRHLFTRGVAVLSGVALPFTTAIDTIIGLGASIGAIGALGRSDYLNLQMANHSHSFKHFPSRVLSTAVHILNPDAKIVKKKDGLITHFVKSKLDSALHKCTSSDYHFNKQITSRLVVAVKTIAAVITRVVDFIFGVLAAPLAVLTFGSFKELNTIAYRGLQITGIATDIIEGVVQFLNPEADLRMGYINKSGDIHYLDLNK